jgi:hypothetical protein
MGDLSNFERERIVGARLVGAAVTKLAHYYVYRERQFLRSCRHTRIMRRQQLRRETVGENQHREKEIVVHWEALFRTITQLQQHRWQQNWICILILKTQVPQKLSDVSFTNPASAVGLQLLNLWWLKGMFKCIKDGVTTIKPGHQTTGNFWHQLSRVGCVTRQITSRLIWYSEFIEHSLLHLYNSQIHNYCHLQYQSYFCCSHFHPLDTTVDFNSLRQKLDCNSQIE